MRILYLTHRLPYAPNRGDRIRAYHTLHHLARRHAVDLVSFVHDDEEAAHAGDLAAVTRSTTVLRLNRLATLTRGAMALLNGRTLTHAMLDTSEWQERVSEVVASNRPDVVLAYCSGMARFALESPLRVFPYVLDMVDVDSGKWTELGQAGKTPKHWIYRREATLLRTFERHAIRAARTTLVVNHRERQSAVAIAGDSPVEIVPNGIDLSGFRSARQPATEPRVVFCGVMNYAPNTAAAEWLIREVWPLVRLTRPDATLAIVGANPPRRLTEMAAGDRSVEVTGAVPDVRPYLWRAAVGVAPLFVARGIQNKVLEAIAAGLPTVVTSAVLTGLPNEVLPACLQADTAREFAAHVVNLLAMGALERRALTREASLDALDWKRRLAPIDAILTRAAQPVRLTA